MTRNPQIIEPQNWKRSKQFEFFKDFDQPFFNITAQVDVTKLLHYCKEHGKSFFLNNLFWVVQTVNEIEEFRMRITADQQIAVFENIDVGSTLLYDDNTFGFGVFEYSKKLIEFEQRGEQTIQETLLSKSFEPKVEKNDIVHCSVLPWVNFTAVSHAKKLGINDSIPKLVFGQYTLQNNRYVMPVSVDVHHALMDGYHVGRFFYIYQNFLDNFSLKKTQYV